MKKNLRKILILVFALLCVIFTNNVYAFENVLKNAQIPKTTEAYNKWLKLSEKEKENAIQPIPFSTMINFNDSFYKSSRLYMLNNLKANLGTAYNLNENIKVQVKNQGLTKRCWAFSLSSVLETTIAKKTLGETYKTFSPIHMDYWVFNNSKAEFNEGGNPLLGYAYYTAGAGPVDDNDDLTTYIETNYTKYPDTYISKFKSEYQVEQYTRFPIIEKKYTTDSKPIYTDGANNTRTEEEVKKIRESIKDHIQTCGAVTSLTALDLSTDDIKYLNIENHAYYCNEEREKLNHQITIVGWNDNYSKDKFNTKPIENGAWIVLNSWGDNYPAMDNGYYYVSYYDRYIEYNVSGVNRISEIDYDNIYQYDELGDVFDYPMHTNDIYYANVFDKKENNTTKKEYLKEVGFYFATPANVNIYYAKWDKTNKKILGEKQLIKSLKASEISKNGYFTYYTYQLNENEYIEIDDSFVIITEYLSTEKYLYMPLEIYFEYTPKGENTPVSNTAWQNIKKSGNGFASLDGVNWENINSLGIYELEGSNYKFYFDNADLCIKAFTSYLDNINVKSVSLNLEKSEMNEGDTLQLAATVSPKTATNKEVTWKSNNEEVAKVDENGKVTAISSGKATIIVTTKDQAKTASCEITVNEKAKDILVTQIDLNANQKEIYIGDKFKINATITPDNATNKDLTWETEDKTIATVSNDGTVTGVAKGKVTIKVTNKASGKSAVCVVTVLDKKEDEYYKEQEEKIVENTNNTDTTDNQENTVNNSTEEIQTTDDTTYGAIIPQTGIKAGVKIVLIVIASFGIISFVKFYRRRDI